MRLLHFDAQDRLILTDFRGKSIPPYAILSHRWTDSETLIEDVANGVYQEKQEGYRKLKFCAEQAAKDGLQYFWIDTCCIDRWDNNERSKAINSMFQWYRNAARCYVFLSDVSLSAVTQTIACSNWEASFRASAWFTRGWTLQELIAPQSVEFFSHEGQRIGDKASLEQLIHEITGIPPTALRNSPLDQFSTFERMRWAEKRTTTEKEDIVYCPLGILGIEMPATYGEGKKSASRRLQAEIEAAGNAPSIIPFSRNESFVGRESHLGQVEAKLFSDQHTTTTIAIVGPGGTGKSQLALEVAHRVRLYNKDCSVFWMDASDTSTLYRSYASVAQKLSIPGCDDDQADTKQVVKRCVAEISTRQCLLIFDNVDGTTARHSRSLSTSKAAFLAEFLPHSKLCTVIFTTTESDMAEALAPKNVTALHDLTPDMALMMLQNRLTKPLSHVDQQQAMHLLRRLSYLPLAIVQVAAHMEASSMTVHQYQAQLAKHTEAALNYSNDPSEGELRRSGARYTVAATLSLSISQVRQSNVVAPDYLFLAACLDRKDIPLDLLETASPRAREDAIKVLDRYTLVTRRPAESALDVHRLVHQALRKRLQEEGRLQEWVQRTTTQLLQVFPNHDHSSRSKWRRLLPHAQYVLSHSERNDDGERSKLAQKCAMALYGDGQYKEAEELLVQVAVTRKRVLGEEHPDTLISINDLARALDMQGKYREAEAMHRQTLAMFEKVLGREHPHTLTSTSNLALVLDRQGKYQEAEVVHRQTLVTREKVLGCEHPDTLMSMNNLAGVLNSQGKYEDAGSMYRQTLEHTEKVLGREHPDTLTSMGNLALVLDSQGRYEEAEAMHRKTLAHREKVLGLEHPDTLTSMNNLAGVLNSQGKYEDAGSMYRQTLEHTEKVLGREHPDTLTSMGNLAGVLNSQCKHEEAEAMHRRTLAHREKVLGHKHPNTLSSVYCLAHLLAKQCDYKESLALYKRACEGYSVVLGEHHPTTRACRQHRSVMLASQQQSQVVFSPAAPEKGVGAFTGKA